LKGDRYDPIRSIIGESALSKIRNSTFLLVGCGAIGCELARDLALFGPKKIIFFDQDFVDSSNTTRQFLYLSDSIGENKAEVSAAKIKEFNKDIDVESFPMFLTPDTLLKLTSDKKIDLDKLSCIISAIDNTEGRNFLASLAFRLNIPFLNHGAGFSLQTNIPGVSIDHFLPQKNGQYPIFKPMTQSSYHLSCGVHSYPNNPTDCIKYIAETQFREEFSPSINEKVPSDLEQIVKYNIEKFNYYYYNNPKSPKRISFDKKNSDHISCVKISSKLKAEFLNIKFDENDFNAILDKIDVSNILDIKCDNYIDKPLDQCHCIEVSKTSEDHLNYVYYHSMFRAKSLTLFLIIKLILI